MLVVECWLEQTTRARARVLLPLLKSAGAGRELDARASSAQNVGMAFLAPDCDYTRERSKRNFLDPEEIEIHS